MFKCLRRKENSVVDSVIRQQEDNLILIEDLLRRNNELMKSSCIVDEDIFDIIECQQAAIRKLQKNVMELEKLNKSNEP